jgi:signal transduction histidine kinase
MLAKENFPASRLTVAAGGQGGLNPMADHELLPLLQNYLASSSLDEKDRLLRRMRDLAGSVPDREALEDRRLPDSFQEARQGNPEEEALCLLLAGYGRLGGYDHPGADEAFEQLTARNTEEQSRPLLYLTCRAGLGLALSLSERGLNLQALQKIKSLDALLKKLELPSLSGEAGLLRARALRRLGRNQEALEQLHRTLTLFQQADDEYGIAGVEDTLGLAALDLGQMDQAELFLQRALARKTQMGDRCGLAYTLGNLGRYFASREQDDQAAEYLHRKLDLCEELGQLKGRMVARQGLARIAWRAGQWNRARDYLRQVEDLVRQAGSRLAEAYLLFTKADYLLARGEWEEAGPLHRKTRDLFGPQPGDLIQAHLALQAAQIAAGAGDRTRAEEKFIQARESFRQLQRPFLLARVEFDWGVWLAREDRLDEAAPHIAQAIAQARSFEAPRMAARFATACESIGTDHWLQALCRAKALAEALAAEKARFHKMAETIIHDLKNKMIILNMALKRAENRMEKGKDFRQYVTLVQGQGLYMENVLKSYLQGLRAEEGQALNAGQFVDLDPILGEMRTVFSVLLEEKNLELVIESRPAGIQLPSNPLLLRLILFNLLDNAIKYTPRGRGSIRLEAWQETSLVRIAVSDPGEGIPENLLERVFQKWGRLEGKEVSYSTGLGLFHTKIMVEALGGRIAVESQVGRGTAFCIHFPVL